MAKDLTSLPAAVANAEPRWRPSRFIKFSAGLHAVGAGMIAVHPEIWPWVAGAVAVDQSLLSTVGLFPRSTLLGPNLRRLPPAAIARRQIALTFDDGPDPEVTPRVLDILDRYGAAASFFCIGERVRAYPRIAAEIARRGHSVENHSLSHPIPFGFYGPAALRREIEGTQRAIADAIGRLPAYFRAPFGIRSPMLEPVIARLGLQLASWTRRGIDTVDGKADNVAGRLCQGLAAGDILLLHDRVGAKTAEGTPVALEVLPTLLARIKDAGLASVSLTIGCDARAAAPKGEALSAL